jgi:transposase InsO family protein
MVAGEGPLGGVREVRGRTRPYGLWVADFTYVPSWAGTVYVAFCIDAFSRRILGWKASMSKQTNLVLDVVARRWAAVSGRPPVICLDQDAGVAASTSVTISGVVPGS